MKHVLFTRITKKSVFCTVKARFTDKHLIRALHYYGQFALSLKKETP